MTQFELWINNTLVDLRDDFPLSFNYSIAEIQKPDTRQSSFSKTIVIPASKSNRDLFDYIFELSSYVDSSGTVNYDPDFNPNLKASAVAYADSVEVFNGIVQLLKINITDNEDIEFEICLVGQLVNLFKNIGDAELTDLDFSDLNHDYTLAEIEASWGNVTGYVYPLIDYGRSQVVTDFPLSGLYPAIFVKDYIDRIFEDAGAVYESDFFDSSFFGSLIIPFNGADFKITEAEITERKFRASRETTDLQITLSYTNTNTPVVFNDDTTAPNFDNSSQFNTTTGRFTVGTGLQGNYNFGTYLNVTARYVPDTPAVDVRAIQSSVAIFTFVKQDLAGNNTFLNNLTVKIRQGADGTYSINTDTETSPTYPNINYIGTNTGEIYFQSGAVELIETDKVFIICTNFISNQVPYGAQPFSPSLSNGILAWLPNELFIDALNNVYDGTYYLRINIGSYFYNEIANASYVEGLPINMNNAVLRGVKQKDFLMSIIKMFNLYLEQDKEVSNKFIIEPRDDGYYYEPTTPANLVDLTKKLDVNQPLEIEPMGALDFKEYDFKYKEDKDYFNQQYFNKWGETYSERHVEVNNDFLQDVKTTGIIFSPTPSIGSSSTDRVIPRIVNIDINGTVSPVSFNPRILIWSGLKATNQVWTITDSTGANSYTEYPYAGMLDDPYSPTVSLDWEVPDEIYWTNIFNTITYTNKNLYNQYWKKFIEEITDRNSKIVRGWFDIRPYDFTQLDFRKAYFFENEYFRLNKIINYNPLNNSLTQMEFVKINRGVTTSYTYEEATDVHNVDRTPRFNNPFSKNDNIRRSGEFDIVSGFENRIPSSVRSFSIIGDGNIIGENSQMISIIGGDNLVAGDSSGVFISGDGNKVGGSNVTLINTFNKTIDFSNSTYINGRCVSGNGSVAYVTANKTVGTDGNDDAVTYLCDATTGNITFTLPSASDFGMGNFMNIKKIDSTSNKITITPDGTETIDGDVNAIIKKQNNCVTIQSDGQNWYII